MCAHSILLMGANMVLVLTIGFALWWFAVIDTKGEVAFFEYQTQTSCENVRRSYARVAALKLTTCQFTEQAPHGFRTPTRQATPHDNT